MGSFYRVILILLLYSISTINSGAQQKREMSNQRLGQLIQGNAQLINDRTGFWEFSFYGKRMVVITDSTHNRMRIMTPIVNIDSVSAKEMRTLLEANFDRALDAKYAVSRDMLWSVYTHPLKELYDDQFLDAMTQVKTLADNYGSSYSSSDLEFGGK